jgi:hypothetical protein
MSPTLEVRIAMTRRESRGRVSSRPRPGQRRFDTLEILEDRRLLSTGVSSQTLAPTVWNVRSKGSNDVIVIDRNAAIPQDLRVFRNGALLGEKPAAEVKAIHVSTGAGSDVVRVDQSVAPIAAELVVYAGSGNDSVIGGSGRNVLHAGAGEDTLRGPGTNVIVGGGKKDKVLEGTAAVGPQPLGSSGSLRGFLSEAYRLQKKSGTPKHGQSGGSGSSTGSKLNFAPTAPSPVGSTSGYSGTNNQVAGVNEADIVQTDGTNLYILTAQDLVIVAAQPSQDLAVLSTTAVEGSPIAMFLDGTRVTVISQVYPNEATGPNGTLTPTQYLASTQTKISVFDVSNPSAPVLTGATYLDGDYVDARDTGGETYVVVQNDVLGAVSPDGDGTGGAAVLASLARNAIDQVLPTFDTAAYGPGAAPEVKGLLTEPADILGSTPTDDDSLESVVEFNDSNPVPVIAHAVSLFTPWDTVVYASTASLYLVTPDYTQFAETTEIDKFALGASGPTLVATGQVPGAVFDSYSVDESGPYLRLATEIDNYAPDGTDQSSVDVYVLTQQGSNLAMSGSLTNIMPGGSLSTARFAGNLLYLTAFGSSYDNTPLVVVDLSHPSAPTLDGVLNDMASTEFLQPIDATHLVGIGQLPGATDTSSDQLELSLYDVSDPTNPTLVSRTILDDGSQGDAYSAAEYDPHALSYFADQGILAVPVTVTIFNNTGSSGGGTPEPLNPGGPIVVDPILPVSFTTQSALDVFQVNPASGLTSLGSVSDTSEVLRSVRIAGVVYTISDNDVQANQLTTGLPPIATVTIATPSSS